MRLLSLLKRRIPVLSRNQGILLTSMNEWNKNHSRPIYKIEYCVSLTHFIAQLSRYYFAICLAPCILPSPCFYISLLSVSIASLLFTSRKILYWLDNPQAIRDVHARLLARIKKKLSLTLHSVLRVIESQSKSSYA